MAKRIEELEDDGVFPTCEEASEATCKGCILSGRCIMQVLGNTEDENANLKEEPREADTADEDFDYDIDDFVPEVPEIK